MKKLVAPLFGIMIVAAGMSPAAAASRGHSHGRPIAVAPPGVRAGMTQSNNWSGYAQGRLEKGHDFHAITGAWTVPNARPRKDKEEEFSSTWVGIGGGCIQVRCSVSDPTLIQAGTEQDIVASCPLGGSCSYSPLYTAWYELIPGPSVEVDLPINPGDQVTVDIHETSIPQVWFIGLSDVTTHTDWTTTIPYTSTYATAEWIEETPVSFSANSGASVGPLPDLGIIRFDAGSVNHANPDLFSMEAIQLVDLNRNAIATPSSPDTDGDGFNDCTYASNYDSFTSSPSTSYSWAPTGQT